MFLDEDWLDKLLEFNLFFDLDLLDLELDFFLKFLFVEVRCLFFVMVLFMFLYFLIFLEYFFVLKF